jgi:hypothetical protein
MNHWSLLERLRLADWVSSRADEADTPPLALKGFA